MDIDDARDLTGIANDHTLLLQSFPDIADLAALCQGYSSVLLLLREAGHIVNPAQLRSKATKGRQGTEALGRYHLRSSCMQLCG